MHQIGTNSLLLGGSLSPSCRHPTLRVLDPKASPFYFIPLIFLTCIFVWCVCVYMYVLMVPAIAYTWRSEDNFVGFSPICVLVQWSELLRLMGSLPFGSLLGLGLMRALFPNNKVGSEVENPPYREKNRDALEGGLQLECPELIMGKKRGKGNIRKGEREIFWIFQSII